MALPNPQHSSLVYLPSEYGEFEIQTIASDFKEFPHLIIQSKQLDFSLPLLLRIHSECFTGDVLGSKRCDCAFQLHHSLKRMNKEGGMLIYLRQEGRGIGLHHKIEAYALQDQGLDTIEANTALGFNSDERDYSIVAEILHQRKIKSVRLMSNNPQKINFLKDQGIQVDEVIPLIKEKDPFNQKYLRSKRDKMGHKIPLDF
ncbi:MAG: GTP cyclohydrolase II [Saprospiraceae bacterium]|nr:GTP cyclohydrolase II [Saprospiraceae bacterium]